MEMLGQLYTFGIWTVHPGKEPEFKRLWDAFARWSSQHQPGAGDARLVQDLEIPNRFISYGPWASTENILAWRATPEFKEFAAQAQEICADFQPGRYKLVSYIPSGSEK
jgi:quinol monooxygenase YgiN